MVVWPAGHFARPYPFFTLRKRSGLSRDCGVTHEPFPAGIGRNLEFINVDDSVIVNIDLARRPELLFELEGKPSHGENKESFF